MRKALAWAVAGTTITAGLLSVAATANAATASPRAKAPTSLSVHESSAAVNAKGKDVITGTLSQGRKALPGEVVTLDTVQGKKMMPAGTARTSKAGGVSFTVSPKVTTTYELVFKGTGSLAASKSRTVTVRVGK